jgi:hypothetical protein
MTILQRVESAELWQLEEDAKKMLEEDVPAWLGWDQVSEAIRNEYRRLARVARDRTRGH